MAKQSAPKLAKNQAPTAATEETGEVEPLVAKTAKFLGECLDTLEEENSLSEEQQKCKEIIFGPKHSLLDAIVDLGNLAIKFDECRSRKQIAEVLEENDAEMSGEDREIIKRYLDSLQGSGT